LARLREGLVPHGGADIKFLADLVRDLFKLVHKMILRFQVILSAVLVDEVA
jgi:hypothetical protein